MRYITDFHLHTKYSRATSIHLDIKELTKWGHLKGLNILGTSDFTHPKWFKELSEMLEPSAQGLYQLKKQHFHRGDLPASVIDRPFHFILTTEISCIYSKGEKTRRIHLIIAFPSLDHVAKFNKKLEAKGAKLHADGRPILGMDAKDVAAIALSVCETSLVIPAHAWTPWFSIFGSKSGFESIEECFEELSDQIFSVETGLSSDPSMNWRMKDFQHRFVVSNSDAHSGPKLGREANVFELQAPSYDAIYRALKERDASTFVETFEFYPEEGKYHYDGHAKCGVSLHPHETKSHQGICPKCHLPLTIGVLSQIERLADFPEGHIPPNVPKHRYIVPLPEILSEIHDKGWQTKTVQDAYFDLLGKGGDEFHLLLDAPIGEIRSLSNDMTATAINKMRTGDLEIKPGYDGIYGVVKIFKSGELKKIQPTQQALL